MKLKLKLKQAASSLAEMSPGQTAQITAVGGGGAIRQRLLDMGILPRVFIQLERVAPSGDPIWIRLGGYQLSLRRHEATVIEVVASQVVAG